MNILGISCFYHDSAAALLRDGDLVAAAHEERFTRKRHDPDIPVQATRWCLEEAGIAMDDLDYLVFYDKPLIKFELMLLTYLSTFPRSLPSFSKAIPVWLKEKLLVPKALERALGYQGEILFAEHHQSHAASAFLPSPFEEAAILTLDGVGEWATAVDCPVCMYYDELMEVFPEAKVVLTVRDPEQWWKSFNRLMSTVNKERLLCFLVPKLSKIAQFTDKIIIEDVFGGRLEKEHCIRIFERHNDAVRNGVPKDRLLEYDVRQGWEPLCTFLGVPIPEKPFPHLNVGRRSLYRLF